MADSLVVDNSNPVFPPPAPEEGDEANTPLVLLGSEEEGDGFALAGDEETLDDVTSGKKKSDPVLTIQPQEANLSLQEIWRLPDKYYLLQNAPYAIEKINEVVKIPQTLRIRDGEGRIIERTQEVTIYEVIFQPPIASIKAKEIRIVSEKIIEDVPDHFRYWHNVWVNNDQLPDGTPIDSIPTDEQVQTFNHPDSGTEHVIIANRTIPVVYTPHLETNYTINLRLYTDTVLRGNCYERNRFGYSNIVHASQELGVQIPVNQRGFDDAKQEYIDTQTNNRIDSLGYLIDEKGYKVDAEGNPVFKERTYRTQNTWQQITLTPVPGQEIPASGKFYIPSMDNILFLDESTQYPIEQTGQGFTIQPIATGMVEIRGWFLDDYSKKPDSEPTIYRFYWTQKLASITPTELAAKPVTAPEPEAPPAQPQPAPEAETQTGDLGYTVTDLTTDEKPVKPKKPSRVERKPEEPWDVKRKGYTDKKTGEQVIVTTSTGFVSITQQGKPFLRKIVITEITKNAQDGSQITFTREVERFGKDPFVWDLLERRVKETTVINPGADLTVPSGDDVVIENRFEYDDWLNNIHTTSVTHGDQTRTITERRGETTTRTYESGAPSAEHEITAPQVTRDKNEYDIRRRITTSVGAEVGSGSLPFYGYNYEGHSFTPALMVGMRQYVAQGDAIDGFIDVDIFIDGFSTSDYTSPFPGIDGGEATLAGENGFGFREHATLGITDHDGDDWAIAAGLRFGARSLSAQEGDIPVGSAPYLAHANGLGLNMRVGPVVQATFLNHALTVYGSRDSIAFGSVPFTAYAHGKTGTPVQFSNTAQASGTEWVIGAMVDPLKITEKIQEGF